MASPLDDASPHRNLVSILSAHAQRHPDKIAFGFLHDGEVLEDVLTYAELDRRVRHLASLFQARELAGQCVLLHCKPGLDFVVAFWACLYAGVIAVPTHQAKPGTNNWKRLEAIVNDATAKMMVTTSDTYSSLDRTSADAQWMASMPVIQVDSAAEQASPVAYREPALSPSTVAFLQYTSGSTGNPKGVVVSHGNLIHNEEILRTGCSTDANSIFVSWLPLFHDMGLIGKVIHSAYLGATCYLMPPAAFVQKPFRWLKAISDYRADTSFAPNFAYEHCVNRVTAEEVAQLKLDCWITALNGAEPIRASTMAAFAEKFAPAGLRLDANYPGYGLAEATLMVSGHVDRGALPTSYRFLIDELEQQRAVMAGPEVPLDASRELVCSGRVLLDQELLIVDPTNRLKLEEGSIGEIWLRGGSVAQGYWRNESATRDTFQATLADDPQHKHYMRTGDLGFLLDSRIYLTGRLKDVIIVRGRNHYPQDIEATAQTASPLLSVDKGAAFSITDEDGDEKLVVVQEVSRMAVRKIDPVPLLAQIRARISEEHDLAVHRVVLLKPGHLPRTSSGKIQRRLCRQLFIESALGSLDGMSPQGELLSLPVEPAEPAVRIEGLLAWLRSYSARRLNSRLMDERRALTPSLILDFGNQGVLGMSVPRHYGGLGLSQVQVQTVVSLLGSIDQSLALLVLLNNVLGIHPVLRFGSEQQRAALLPALASGRALAAFALTEPGAGSNPRAIQSTARADGQGRLVLSGHKSWIGVAAWANHINVFAQEYNAAGEYVGLSGFIVEQDDEGLIQGEEAPTMGMRAMLQNAVHFDGLVLPAARRLGEPGKGMEVAQSAMQLGRLGIGAMGLGGIRRCLQLMQRYASRRTISTGVLIDNAVTRANFKSLVAAAETLEGLNTLVAARVDSGADVQAELYSVVKVAGSEFFWEAADTLMQTLGGRGYIENNVAPQLMRDARVLRIFEGPTESLLADLGSRLGTTAAADALLRGSLGCAASADRHAAALEQLQQAHPGGTPEARQVWTFMTGQLGFWSVLLAANKAASPSARAWLQARFERCLQEQLSGQAWVDSEAEAQHIEGFLASNNDWLAGIDQRLPGEDKLLDAMLQPAGFVAPAGQPPLPASDVTPPPAFAETPQFQAPVPVPVADDGRLGEMVARLTRWCTLNLKIKLPANAATLTFSELGFDSFQAALLTSDLSSDLGVELDITSLWSFPTLQDYARHLLSLTGAAPAHAPAAPAPVSEARPGLGAIDAMSEAEASALLAQMLKA